MTVKKKGMVFFSLLLPFIPSFFFFSFRGGDEDLVFVKGHTRVDPDKARACNFFLKTVSAGVRPF